MYLLCYYDIFISQAAYKKEIEKIVKSKVA